MVLEAVFAFSEFFEDSFNVGAHLMMGDLQARQPTSIHTVPSVQQFLTKNGMTPMPHPPYSPNLRPKQLFFSHPDEKSPQREMFC